MGRAILAFIIYFSEKNKANKDDIGDKNATN